MQIFLLFIRDESKYAYWQMDVLVCLVQLSPKIDCFFYITCWEMAVGPCMFLSHGISIRAESFVQQKHWSSSVAHDSLPPVWAEGLWAAPFSIAWCSGMHVNCASVLSRVPHCGMASTTKRTMGSLWIYSCMDLGPVCVQKALLLLSSLPGVGPLVTL